MTYCKVESGKIYPPAPLPTNYRNISGFYLIDENIINSYGFYKYIPTSKPSYNKLTHKIDENFVLENNRIFSIYTITELNTEEIQTKLNEIKLFFIAVVENFLDSTVKERDYKNILHACSYTDSTVLQYKNEAIAVVAWRDAVWIQAYTIQEEILSGQRIVPSEEQFLNELPKLEWPQ